MRTFSFLFVILIEGKTSTAITTCLYIQNIRSSQICSLELYVLFQCIHYWPVIYVLRTANMSTVYCQLAKVQKQQPCHWTDIKPQISFIVVDYTNPSIHPSEAMQTNSGQLEFVLETTLTFCQDQQDKIPFLSNTCVAVFPWHADTTYVPCITIQP